MRPLRVWVCSLLTALVIGLPLPADADAPVLIAVVRSRALAAYEGAGQGFGAALTAAGRTPRLMTWDLGGDARAAAGVVDAIEASGAALVLTMGSLATTQIAAAVRDRPVVFCMVLDPTSSGLPAPGAAAGRPLTGVTMDIPPERQLDALRLVLPGAHKVGIFYAAESSALAEHTREAGKRRGLEVLVEPVASEKDLPRLLPDLSARVDVLMALPDATVWTESTTRYALLHTLRQAQPFVGLMESFVKAGALLAVGLDHGDLGRQAGEMAVRILGGEAAGRIPVEAPREMPLLLNLRTARRIGVTIPPAALAQAEVLVP